VTMGVMDAIFQGSVV